MSRETANKDRPANIYKQRWKQPPPPKARPKSLQARVQDTPTPKATTQFSKTRHQPMQPCKVRSVQCPRPAKAQPMPYTALEIQNQTTREVCPRVAGYTQCAGKQRWEAAANSPYSFSKASTAKRWRQWPSKATALTLSTNTFKPTGGQSIVKPLRTKP